ncbi:MAG TPA: hypothetical protein VLW50_08350, partial [Streptosporangiaceae bacterium]|nr:hypothetical protein [Streptosporangiaceae bacterium]
QDQAPAGEDQVPAGEAKVPAGQDQVPAGEDQVPAGEAKVPAGQDQAPAGQDQAPARESLGPGNRAEPEASHAEAAEPTGQPRKPRRHRLGWRAPVAAVLIILGCILAPLSVLGAWTANQVSDTGRYVANMAPLIENPAIQNALTNKITNEIVTQLNVKGLTDQAAAELSQKGLPRLGGLLQGVAGSLASGVQGFVHSRVHKIITGPRMAAAWTQVNRASHQALVAVLSGRYAGHGAVGVSNGQVTIDVAPLEAVAKQDLAARGLTAVNKIPTVHATFPLFPSKDLVKAQSAYRLINDLKIVLPILTLVLLGLGVLTAKRHRRALLGAGLGFAASMLVLGAGLAIARVIYLNSLPATVSSDAAAAAFDILVRFIRTALRTLLVVGLVVAAGAFFTGPSAAAVATRSAFSAGLGRLRRGGESAGLSTGPVGTWTYAHRRALRIAAVTLAALIFVFWGRPTAAVTIVIAVLLLVVLGLIELIGRPPPKSAPASPAPGG